MADADDYREERKKRDREYLIAAFTRASVFYAGIDLQPEFFAKPSLRENIIRANGLATAMRGSNVPIRWVLHLKNIAHTNTLPATDLSHALQKGIRVVGSDRARVKNANRKSYADLFDEEFADGLDTPILTGGQAEACVTQALHYGINRKWVTSGGAKRRPRAVIAFDATDISDGLTKAAADGLAYEQLETMRERAHELWGNKAIILSVDEIKECRREADKRLRKATPPNPR